MLVYNKTLKKYARSLRKRSTEAEIYLWSKVWRKQLADLQFYRQRIIGNYIVDFFCPRAKLVIEIDGSQHYLEKARELDDIRDKYMRNSGLKVLRFTGIDVLTNIDGVVETIIKNLDV